MTDNPYCKIVDHFGKDYFIQHLAQLPSLMKDVGCERKEVMIVKNCISEDGTNFFLSITTDDLEECKRCIAHIKTKTSFNDDLDQIIFDIRFSLNGNTIQKSVGKKRNPAPKSSINKPKKETTVKTSVTSNRLPGCVYRKEDERIDALLLLDSVDAMIIRMIRDLLSGYRYFYPYFYPRIISNTSFIESISHKRYNLTVDLMKKYYPIFKGDCFIDSSGFSDSVMSDVFKTKKMDEFLHITSTLNQYIENGTKVDPYDLLPMNIKKYNPLQNGLADYIFLLMDIYSDDHLIDDVCSSLIPDVSHLENMAGRGDAECQYKLAILYAYGISVNKSEYMALDWCKKAVDGKYAKAAVLLCGWYGRGFIVEKSKPMYNLYRTKAAELGDTDYQIMVAKD